jgi:hypothetical protein
MTGPRRAVFTDPIVAKRAQCYDAGASAIAPGECCARTRGRSMTRPRLTVFNVPIVAKRAQCYDVMASVIAPADAAPAREARA